MITPDDVIATLPGWEEAEWQPLTGGQTNDSWLLRQRDQRAVLKVDTAPRVTPFNSRREEGRIQQRAADAGLAGRVLHTADTFILTEYVDGEAWTGASLSGDDNLIRLAKALKKLHAMPLTGRRFDALAAAKQYAARIDEAERARVEECIAEIVAMPAAINLCCCHNDLVAGNIIVSSRIRFIDWEYACDNDPLFDLATVNAHLGLSEPQADLLLRAYYGNEFGANRLAFEKYCRAYLALCWLWDAARS